MALSDLKLIEPLLTLLGVLAKSPKGRQSERLSRIHRSCMESFEKANTAVERTNLAQMNHRDQGIVSKGGESQGRENIDDFLRRMENISSGHDDVELDSLSPGVSRDFAMAVEQQFQEWTSI